MPYTDIFRRFNRELSTTWNPEFHVYGNEDPAALAAALREAFTFMRRHSDRRYSSSSLMRILNAADRLDAAVEAGVAVLAAETPRLAIARVPYTFDPDTEVKTGGVVAAAFVEPGGKTILAVHQDKRRAKVGKAMVFFVENYLMENPQYWCHRGNLPGLQFLANAEMQPWEMNSRGAVQFARREPTGDSDAVEYEDENRLDQAIARRDRNRVTPRRRPVIRDHIAGVAYRVPEQPDMPEHYLEDGPEEDEEYVPTPGQVRLQEVVRELHSHGISTWDIYRAEREGLTPQQLLMQTRNQEANDAVLRAAHLNPNTVTVSEMLDAGFNVRVQADPDLERLLAEEEERIEQQYVDNAPLNAAEFRMNTCGDRRCDNPDCEELREAMSMRDTDQTVEENLWLLSSRAFESYLRRREVIAAHNGNTQTQMSSMVRRLRALREAQRGAHADETVREVSRSAF